LPPPGSRAFVTLTKEDIVPQSLDDIMSAKGDSAPEANHPEFSEADRAANPLGISRAERQRDGQGRFAPKEGDAPEGDAPQQGEEPQAAPDKRRPSTVPQQAIAAARDKSRTLADENAELKRRLEEVERRLTAPQPPVQRVPQQAAEPPKPPEFWVNPDEATDFRVRRAVDPVMQQMQEMRLGFSKQLATTVHGEGAVTEAIQALGTLRQQNPGEFARLEAQAASSADPVGDVVRWHKRQRTLQEVGEDPAAYRERIRQEVLAEMQTQQGETAPQPASQSQPRLPSSFAAPSAGGPRVNGYGGPRALSDIMGR
jgi:hypothetical protein